MWPVSVACTSVADFLIGSAGDAETVSSSNAFIPFSGLVAPAEFSFAWLQEMTKTDVNHMIKIRLITFKSIGMLVAESLGLPFVYVRPEAKKHGRLNQVEGFLQKGQNVVVVEDLISTGNSSLLAVEALREAGANIKGMAAIFTYGFNVAEENFKNAHVDLFTLSNYQNLLNLAVAKRYITEEEEQTLREWNVSPSTWTTEV